MGAIRFLLAYMVLLSHLGITFFQLNLGVSAVVIFYLLSGNVVSHLWTRWHAQPNGLKLFYVDRAWRILPQYVLALLCAIALWINGVDSPFISAKPDTWDWLFNIAVIPLNFFMLTGREHFILVPPAWSLAAELQFYLIAPLIVYKKPKLLISLLILSMSIFVLAQFNHINLEIYGYRLLPGMLFVFLIGGMLNDKLALWKKRLLSILWGISVIYFLWLISAQEYQAYNREVALGLMIGIPIIWWRNKAKTEQSKLKAKQNKVSRWYSVNKTLGFLSYGVFLYHFIVIWSLELASDNINSIDVIKVSLITLIISYLGHKILEKPIWLMFRNSCN
jgi:peptidoglycan/LPS O-acetylase OafA/YrhL